MSTSATTAAPTGPAELPGRLEDLGWHLGVLLRAYRATVGQQNPADRRARRVVATPEGRRRLAGWAAAVHDAEEELLDMLSPDERGAFRTLMRRVACDLRDIDAGTDPCAVAEHTLRGTTTPPR